MSRVFLGISLLGLFLTLLFDMALATDEATRKAADASHRYFAGLVERSQPTAVFDVSSAIERFRGVVLPADQSIEALTRGRKVEIIRVERAK